MTKAKLPGPFPWSCSAVVSVGWVKLFWLLCCLPAISLMLAMSALPAVAALAPESPPARIVSLGPINTENVYLLGAGDRLVGTTVYCVRPEAAKSTDKIGTVMQVSVEKIIGLRPDLVLATGLTSESQVNLLRKVGLQVVRFDQPTSFASSCQQFEQLGKLLGLEKEALAITHELQGQVKEIAMQIEKLQLPRQKVIMQIGANPLYVAGRDSFTNDYIELILAENGLGDHLSGRVGYERVIAANPDVILIGMMGSETGVAAEQRQKWQKIRVIKAVQDKRIHVVDPNLVCSPSPATFVQALKVIATLIYPEMIDTELAAQKAHKTLKTLQAKNKQDADQAKALTKKEERMQ